jgi:hypothetical protein
MKRETRSPGKAAPTLAYLLKAGNYKATRIGVSISDITSDLRIDISELAVNLRALSTSGLIELVSLPKELEASYVAQVFDDLDALDLRYMENNTDQSEYVSSRQVIADQLKMFPHRVEPFSPLEAARLSHEFKNTLERILGESSRLSQPSEALEDELLVIREKLQPFRRLVLSRINEFTSGKETRPDLPTGKRIRMLLLFSQVGMSRLAMARDAVPGLLEELDVLRARQLIGEISQSEREEKETTQWNEICKRMPPQLPNIDALADWVRHLASKLEALKSLQQRGAFSDLVFRVVSEDLHQDIALLKQRASNAS